MNLTNRRDNNTLPITASMILQILSHLLVRALALNDVDSTI